MSERNSFLAPVSVAARREAVPRRVILGKSVYPEASFAVSRSEEALTSGIVGFTMPDILMAYAKGVVDAICEDIKASDTKY